MKIGFHLKNPPNSDGESPVFIYTRMRNGQLKVYVPHLTVKPNQWSKAKQRVKPSVAGATAVNDALNKIEGTMKSIVADLIGKNIEPTPGLVKSRYKALMVRDASRSSKKGFFDFWEEWLDQTSTSKTASTIRQNRTVMTKLKEYQEDRGATLTFDRIDREFFESFTRYLITVKELTNATIWNQVKRIKAFMQWAQDRGLTTNDYHLKVRKKDFNVQPPAVVRLTEQEFRQLAEFDFSATSYLDNARNLFILQACLGVRVGDLLKIVKDPASYVQGDSIHIVAQKTKKKQVIPLNARARGILFSQSPPHFISDVKLNKYVKEAARLAGLNRTVVISEFRGTNRKEIQIPLHDEISSHCAKRTFVSLMVAGGVHVQVIADITGNTLETIKRYIDLDEKEIMREARKADSVFS